LKRARSPGEPSARFKLATLAQEGGRILSNGYATGSPVTSPPPWLSTAAPQVEWLYLPRGICEVCELQVEHVWQTTHHGYTYCRTCIETIAAAADRDHIS